MTSRQQDHLDRTLRGLHAAATRQVSPTTLGRLRDARHELTSEAGRVSGAGTWRWMAAGFGSVALALALGLQLGPLAPEAVVPAPLAVAPAAVAGSDYPASLAALDEDPDLYLWLAAEAGPLQLEQL